MVLPWPTRQKKTIAQGRLLIWIHCFQLCCEHPCWLSPSDFCTFLALDGKVWMIRCRAMCFMSLTKQMMQWNMFLIHRKNGGMHDLKKCVWIWCMRLQNWRLIFWMPGQLCSEGWTHLCFIDGSLTSTPCAHWDSRVGNFFKCLCLQQPAGCFFFIFKSGSLSSLCDWGNCVNCQLSPAEKLHACARFGPEMHGGRGGEGRVRANFRCLWTNSLSLMMLVSFHSCCLRCWFQWHVMPFQMKAQALHVSQLCQFCHLSISPLPHGSCHAQVLVAQVWGRNFARWARSLP